MDISAFVLFWAAIFTGNILLTYFLGMCSYLSVSREIESAFGLGVAVFFVLVVTTALNWVVYHYILVPFGIVYLQYIVFIIVIAAFVQFLELLIERYTPALYYSLGIFLPLITVNCAILGVSLFMIIRNYNFIQSIAFGAGSGIGWLLAILMLAGIRRKLKEKMVPAGLRGAGISLIITGIMALGFIGFSGIVQIQ
ncbi:MAG: Rnf-Nqr domain containing protein [Candidatus Cloacimonadaceae bacterium]|jgi:Na+-transporting NADH:ubiquinone oxidoreductase subunit E|nr:NADH:ubiquinone reductase (Na(+)-transporting) subunit E [Candidatus Cloacimonadota bacterium]MDY0128034.1 Rnf-Nqr domain containing protein [Candidatus Cloacimonadaceae bacterium]MCB5254544.1 NADH:ubiquinone reductase (Na(+)-transporting) subunit E [Candidatus Cloacimonadota bacterium]MCK9178798.1 NADH:ubiquinone reductase (Na(+)-transporting) subunit E [Candidatus Cloacimonadota bacterium]MCK9242463.1 NADH:ubiquinone reductase (Na(+)-transporting) subunit E [Candidatus Cloacimonadota bacte